MDIITAKGLLRRELWWHRVRLTAMVVAILGFIWIVRGWWENDSLELLGGAGLLALTVIVGFVAHSNLRYYLQRFYLMDGDGEREWMALIDTSQDLDQQKVGVYASRDFGHERERFLFGHRTCYGTTQTEITLRGAAIRHFSTLIFYHRFRPERYAELILLGVFDDETARETVLQAMADELTDKAAALVQDLPVSHEGCEAAKRRMTLLVRTQPGSLDTTNGVLLRVIAPELDVGAPVPVIEDDVAILRTLTVKRLSVERDRPPFGIEV